MAKQPVNIVERHVEKGILGITAVVLLATVAMFLVSTPNKIEMGGETVGPDTIDQRIREAGTRLRDKLRRAPVPDVEVVDRVPQLDEASDPLAYAGVNPQLPAAVPWLPRVPVFRDEAPAPGEIKLAEVIAPGKPKIVFGRASLDIVPPETIDPIKPEPDLTGPPLVRGPFETDANWVTVGALFDQQRQIDVAKRAGYRFNRRNPYLVGIDLQRREKRPDGSYSDWVDVKPYTPRKLEGIPKVEIVSGRSGPTVTQATREQVRRFFRLLKKVQPELHRPLFPRRVFGDPWRYPEFPDIDVHELDSELCPECGSRRYGYEIAKKVKAREPDPRKRIRQMLNEVRQLLDDLRCEDARAKANDVLADPDIRQNEKHEADNLIAQVDQCKRDRERKRRGPSGKGGDTGEETQEIRRSPYQLVWAHDVAGASDGGAVSGRTYQYRIRIRLYNTYCAVVEDLADPADATKVSVVGAWSEPSEDVHIPADTAFFLTSGNPFDESGAKVTIFKWFEGSWVKHAFPVQVGKPITGTARETVRIAEDGQPDRPPIDFDTESTVVDIDYHYVSRRKKKRGKGYRITAPKRTVALVYAGPDGALHQRVLAMDKASQEYKHYRDKVFGAGAAGRR